MDVCSQPCEKTGPDSLMLTFSTFLWPARGWSTKRPDKTSEETRKPGIQTCLPCLGNAPFAVSDRDVMLAMLLGTVPNIAKSPVAGER